MVILDMSASGSDGEERRGKYQMLCAQFRLCIFYIFPRYIKLKTIVSMVFVG